MTGSILRILVPALVVLVAASLFLSRPNVPPPELATELPEPLAVPDMALTDQTGAEFTKADLAGHFTLMFFGYTNCPDVCPLSLQVLATAQKSMRESRPARQLPEVLLVSVDPKRDSPERLREYLAYFDSSFVGVTGSDDNLAPLLARFGVSVMRQELAGEAYTMTHSAQVFVIGPRAELIAILGKAEKPATVAQDYFRIRERYLNGSIGTRPGA